MSFRDEQEVGNYFQSSSVDCLSATSREYEKNGPSNMQMTEICQSNLHSRGGIDIEPMTQCHRKDLPQKLKHMIKSQTRRHELKGARCVVDPDVLVDFGTLFREWLLARRE
jgi:hypothetical protein